MLHAVGFDVGTSGLKAVLVDEFGRIVRSVRECYPLRTPVSGWAEQDPDVWWRAVCVTSQALLDGVAAPDVVGLTGQMHSAVALGPGDALLGPAILWNDQRTVRECMELQARIGDALVTWTGNPIRTAFTATRILWLRHYRPDLYARLGAILLPKDLLRLRLTGVLATDVTDASGTGVFDVPRRRWSEDALQALEIQRAWMPDGSIGVAPGPAAFFLGRRSPPARGTRRARPLAAERLTRAHCRSRSGRQPRFSCPPRYPCPIRAASFRRFVTGFQTPGSCWLRSFPAVARSSGISILHRHCSQSRLSRRTMVPPSSGCAVRQPRPRRGPKV